MDSLSGFLDGPRARGAFLLRSVFDPPWSLSIEDEAPLTIMSVLAGSAWIVPAGAPPVEVVAGDTALIRGPDHYRVADRPDRRPELVIKPGQVCVDLTGAGVAEQLGLGLRSWGRPGASRDVLLTGTYDGVGEISRRLVDALPPLIVLRSAEWSSPLVSLLADEMRLDRPGQSVVLDRLLDLLVVSALREWFDRSSSNAPRWYPAHADPVVGPALRLLHEHPDRPWTVSSLAAAVGASRAALARRFVDQVGEPPIAFLTGWRLALAADLLADPSATVARVARQVGYGSPFTFSTAFKRTYGVSPRAYRDDKRTA